MLKSLTLSVKAFVDSVSTAKSKTMYFHFLKQAFRPPCHCFLIVLLVQAAMAIQPVIHGAGRVTSCVALQPLRTAMSARVADSVLFFGLQPRC